MLQRFPFLRALWTPPWKQLPGGTKLAIARMSNTKTYTSNSGFSGLQAACWPLVPKFARSHPAEAAGFLGRKNPQHDFLRRGSKAVGPMS